MAAFFSPDVVMNEVVIRNIPPTQPSLFIFMLFVTSSTLMYLVSFLRKKKCTLHSPQCSLTESSKCLMLNSIIIIVTHSQSLFTAFIIQIALF